MAEEKKNNEKKSVSQTAPGQNNSNVSSGYSAPERIWNFLTKEKGVGTIEAAAIMGNIAQESMYDTKAVSFDGAGGIGICQWTNTKDSGYKLGRKTDFINYAKSKGKTEADLGDLELQLAFMWHEIESGNDISYMKAEIEKHKNDDVNTRIKAATKCFCDGFEKPGRGYEAYENRYRYAIEAYEKQGKGILAAGTYVPGNTPGAGFAGQVSPAKRNTIQSWIEPEEIGHKDEWKVMPDAPDKTFCEPIYPDLTSIGKDIPSYAIPNNIPTEEMQLVDYKEAGAGLVHRVSTETIIKHSDNKEDLAKFTVYNQKIADQRKEIFDLASHRKAIKVPSAGKPPNNKDPFPVDHKIVELETHQPRCKIDSLNACHHTIDVVKALILLSTDTEKRLVRIENNMATMMRYLYRMAARVNVNCVYYGGQIPCTYPAKGPNGENNKYNCIRCLKDDRIHEGKQVSLDQCLNCTRYEPLIGQIYDIYNDYAINLSQVLDDNQMSYTTMDEYCKFANITERQEPMEKGNMDAANIKTRNKTEIDLDDEWGPGLAMDWSLYPVELQKPHTEPPVEGSLASNYGANSGMALTNGGVAANMLIEARNQIDASDSSAKQTGKRFAESETDRMAGEMKAKLGSQIREYYDSKGIKTGQDSCLIASLMAVYGGLVGDTINKLEKAKSEIKGKGVDNIVLHVMFYSLDQKYLFGDGNDDSLPKRLDKVLQEEAKQTDNQSSNTEPNQNNNQATANTNNDWANVNTWNWNYISKPLTININGKEDANTKLPEQLLNFAKVVYLYKELLNKCSASRFDTAEWGFPFTEEQIASAEIGLNHPTNGEFNNFRGDHYHNGVDIGVFGGSWSKRHPEGSESKLMRQPVHAARDGIVSWLIPNGDPSGGGGGNCMGIQHDNGYSSCYMHLASFAVAQGQKVNRGEVIGYTGGSGGTTLIDYDEHLHFEIRPDGQRTGIDPWSVYNGNLSSRPRPFQFRDIKV